MVNSDIPTIVIDENNCNSQHTDTVGLNALHQRIELLKQLVKEEKQELKNKFEGMSHELEAVKNELRLVSQNRNEEESARRISRSASARRYDESRTSTDTPQRSRSISPGRRRVQRRALTPSSMNEGQREILNIFNTATARELEVIFQNCNQQK